MGKGYVYLCYVILHETAGGVYDEKIHDCVMGGWVFVLEPP